MPQNINIAVIGAGICGLNIANILSRQGFNITVFEKSRGPGGRTSTRRVNISDDHELKFNHGAQYFTARDEIFKAQVKNWQEQGVVKEFTLTSPIDDDKRYVFSPTMNAGCKAMLASGKGINFNSAVRVQSCQNNILTSDSGEDLGAYDLVISTAPPLQTIDIFAGYPHFIEPIKKVQMLPNFTVMLYGKNLPNQAAYVKNSIVSWYNIADNCVIIQSKDAYAMDNVEADKETIKAELIQALRKELGVDFEEQYSTIHRWLYASVDEGSNKHFDKRYILDAQNNIACAGDWFTKSRIEDAYLNGYYLSQAIIEEYKNE